MHNYLLTLFLCLGIFLRAEFTIEKTGDYYHIEEKGTVESFNLVDPEAAPKDIKEQVMLGFHILMDPKQYAAAYAGDKITCTNCHFMAGNTLGGKNNGISLVGVTKKYPSYSKRDKKVIDLADRINSCFERSLNGKPLPKDSPEMAAMLAYLSWISHEVEKLDDRPWLGLPLLTIKPDPNYERGSQIYFSSCASCHQKNGAGTEGVPPLWGPASFNDGAGMHKIPKLAAFVYYNMPRNQPNLTEAQAYDVACYIIRQPHPHLNQSFTPKGS